MRDKQIVPVFNSEAEESQWWFDNRENFARDLKQALGDGSARVGTVARRMHGSRLLLELDQADVDAARRLAARKGVDCETFLRALVHEQLAKELDLLQSEPETRAVAQSAA